MKYNNLKTHLGQALALILLVVPATAVAQTTATADTSATTSGGCQMMQGKGQMKGMMQSQGQGQMKGMMQSQGQGQMKGKMQGQGQGQMHGAGGCQMMGGGMGMTAESSSEPLAPDVAEAIELALQDEYRSEALYQRVLNDHGDVLPFRNIVNSERRHSAHLVGLLTAHGAEAPQSKWTPDNSEPAASVAEACASAVTAEIENIAIYDKLLELDLPADVRQTFTHLQSISRDRHLPAFQRCGGNR